MKRLGFIHDMMDVKVLILYVTARSGYPMTTQEVYEVCYQDECLSYFDVCSAIPQMVESGHLSESDGKSEITEKGRQDGALTEDSIAYTVRQLAENAIIRFNCKLRRSSFVKTRILPREDGYSIVMMTLDDETGNLMNLELMAPNQKQAVRLSRLFEKKAEDVYNLTMTILLDEEDSLEEE